MKRFIAGLAVLTVLFFSLLPVRGVGASEGGFAELCRTAALSEVLEALEAGADVNEKIGKERMTPLMFALRENRSPEII